MAYLKKEQYEYRERSAARRAADNEQIAVEHGMTEEQAELIGQLCALRHELHTNMDKVTVSDNDLRIKSRLVKLNAAIREIGLKPAECMPQWEDDYIDIDDIDFSQNSFLGITSTSLPCFDSNHTTADPEKQCLFPPFPLWIIS